MEVEQISDFWGESAITPGTICSHSKGSLARTEEALHCEEAALAAALRADLHQGLTHSRVGGGHGPNLPLPPPGLGWGTRGTNPGGGGGCWHWCLGSLATHRTAHWARSDFSTSHNPARSLASLQLRGVPTFHCN